MYFKATPFYLLLSGFIFFCVGSTIINCQGLNKKNEKQGKLSRNLNTIDNQYIVTLTDKSDIGVINSTFKEFGLRDVQKIGNNQYLIIIVNDPGINKIMDRASKVKQIKAIQPNYRYRAF